MKFSSHVEKPDLIEKSSELKHLLYIKTSYDYLKSKLGNPIMYGDDSSAKWIFQVGRNLCVIHDGKQLNRFCEQDPSRNGGHETIEQVTTWLTYAKDLNAHQRIRQYLGLPKEFVPTKSHIRKMRKQRLILSMGKDTPSRVLNRIMDEHDRLEQEYLKRQSNI